MNVLLKKWAMVRVLRVCGGVGVIASVLLGGCTVGMAGGVEDPEGVERLEVVDSSGRVVSYLRAGDPSDPRVIYVHGTPGAAVQLAGFLTDPVPGLEAIAIDRPGFGKSDTRRVMTSYEDQARAIEPLLVEREGRWPILVGHSLGGPIIARVAADYPDKVGGLVILSGNLDPDLECPKWYNYVGAFPLLNLWLSGSLRNSNSEIMAAPKQTRLLGEVLDRVRCPVVVVHGTKDSLVPFANVEYMRERFGHIDGFEAWALEGKDHFIPWSSADVIRSVVERMSKHDRGLETGQVDGDAGVGSGLGAGAGAE